LTEVVFTIVKRSSNHRARPAIRYRGTKAAATTAAATKIVDLSIDELRDSNERSLPQRVAV